MRSPYLIALLLFLGACNPAPPEKVAFIILQMNDVYEISPLEGGKVGGLARVATIRNQLLQENPNVITVLSGDFLSPSLAGNMRMENGQKIAGAQMVETLNALGLDYVTFGNHEFDLKEPDLLKRLEESKFAYTVANCYHKTDNGSVVPFEQFGLPIPQHIIHTIEGSNGTQVKLGLVGVILPFNKTNYVHYTDVDSAFKAVSSNIQDSCQLVVGLTHLEMVDDIKLAKQLKDIPLLLGGHDHENIADTIGNVYITKADANAKTVYVHRITYDPATDKSTIQSELMVVDESIAIDPELDKVVQKWAGMVNKIMEDLGYKPTEKLFTATDPLEGREAFIRNEQSNLGTLINDAMMHFIPEARAAIMNSGSIRVDDVLDGDITQYDILRTLPFGGNVGLATFSGEQLIQTLRIGTETNKGIGGYLQIRGLSGEGEEWFFGTEPIDPAGSYKIVAPAFLMSGKEANLAFLEDVPIIFPELPVGADNDLRTIVIDYCKTLDIAETE